MRVVDIFFQISALCYTLLIAIVFITQKKVNKLENHIYKGVLLVTFIEIILDIAYHLSYFYIPEALISEILARLFMCSTITWSVTFTFYIYSLSIDKDNEEMTQERKKSFAKALIILCFLILVLDIITFILPMDIINERTFTKISGPIVLFAYGVIGIDVLLNIIFAFRTKEGLNSKKYAPVNLLTVLTLVGMAIQILYPQVQINVQIVSLVTVFVYFAIENPNLSLIEELNIATQQAENANHAKSDFLSSMSHEIRTPLNAIIGFSQALAKEDISGSAKDEVKDILVASTNLLEIVNGILDISKIEAQKIEIVNVDYSTRELFNEISTLINTRIGSKPIEFKIEVDDKMPPVLYGDSMRIKQILTNLLTNAVKYTNQGHILFQINYQIIGDNCKIMFKVEDTGIGMTEDDVKNLYTKFQRFDMDQNMNVSGTGLGMAITKGLVDLMDGEILVKSEYGKGTTFTVFLEQKISDKPLEDIQHKEENGRVVPFDSKGKKVLVVDDNRINLKVAEKLLSGYNLNIEMLDNGRDCINKILAGEKYDLIFLDIMMPKMKGPEVLQNLKNIIGFDTPVIALTADIIAGMEEKYLSQGFDGCLPKPIVEVDLYYMLKKFLAEEEANTVTVENYTPQHTLNPKNLVPLGVDLEYALARVETEEAYNRKAEEFYLILEEKMNKLYEYKNVQDLENYYMLVKALNDTAKDLGLTKFISIAEQHEIASRDNNKELIDTDYAKLRMESIKVIDLLKKYLGR